MVPASSEIPLFVLKPVEHSFYANQKGFLYLKKTITELLPPSKPTRKLCVWYMHECIGALRIVCMCLVYA